MKSIQFAQQIKKKIAQNINNKVLNALSDRQDPFHNPIARMVKLKKIAFSEKENNFIQQCQNSAKLVLTEKNYEILINYFKKRREVNDRLGNLYKTLSSSDFLLRLFSKRFKEVYFDGRAVVLRNGEIYSKSKGKEFLQNIGTHLDTEDLYKEYLTLEEAVLSPLLLPQVTSLIIGTGSRSNEDKWNIKKEFRESIELSAISYPAAAEFRQGRTAHYDCLFMVKPEKANENYLRLIDTIKKNDALMTAARKIYGKSFAFEVKNNKDKAFIKVIEGSETFYLHEQAYIARTKSTLKNLLLASDAQMANDNLGKTYQLKGLGLGAFSFSGKDITKKLQALYIKSLKELLTEKDFKLRHINCINLINLPTDFKNPQMYAGKVKNEGNIKEIKLIRTIMDPTSNTKNKAIGQIGGVVVCGDSGSQFGNEGNIGLQRSSSDDPAAQYSLFDPCILDPKSNPKLTNTKCIHLVKSGKFVLVDKSGKLNIAPSYPKEGIIAIGNKEEGKGFSKFWVGLTLLTIGACLFALQILNLMTIILAIGALSISRLIYQRFQAQSPTQISSTTIHQAKHELSTELHEKNKTFTPHKNIIKKEKVPQMNVKPSIKAISYKSKMTS